jgi:hypothetical protein
MAIVRKYFMSTDTLKELSLIENNVEEEKLAVMLNRVQKAELEVVLGTVLFKRLLEDIDNNSLAGIYEVLTNEYIIDFLIICCELEYVVSGANKFANMGVGKYNPQDTQVNNLQANNDVRDHLRGRQKSYRDSLIGFLQDNKDDIPEYKAYDCSKAEQVAPEDKQPNPFFSVVTRHKYR